MSKKVKIYELPQEEEIEKRLEQNWGLQRLFSWVNTKAPHHAPILILRYILRVSLKKNQPFSERQVSAFLKSKCLKKELDGERIFSDVKNDLLSLTQKGANK